MTRCIGLTGGIASGKSQVLRLFKEAGFPVLSADEQVHKLMAKGGEAYPLILKEFGEQIVDANAEIDRKKLGDKVFSDSEKKKLLEGILHPLVRKHFDNWVKQNSQEKWLVYEIPLLFETGREKDFDLIFCVASKPSIQLERLMKRNNLTEEEAKLRISNLFPQDKKVEASDVVLWNNFSSLEDLELEFRKQLESSGLIES